VLFLDQLTVLVCLFLQGAWQLFPYSHANEAMGSSRKEMWTHIPVPAFLFVWQAAKPRTAKLKFYFTVATICVFAEPLSPTVFLIILVFAETLSPIILENHRRHLLLR